MDEYHFELAAELEQRTREHAIRAAQDKERLSHTKPEGFDGSCQHCEAKIPEARISAGYYICVPCKEEAERLAIHRRIEGK